MTLRTCSAWITYRGRGEQYQKPEGISREGINGRSQRGPMKFYPSNLQSHLLRILVPTGSLGRCPCLLSRFRRRR